MPRDFESLYQVVNAISLRSSASGPQTSAFFPRNTAQHANVILLTGKVTGAPTEQVWAAKLQESLDSVSGWTDLTALTSTTSKNSLMENPYTLDGARTYLRVLGSTSYTGGTAPTFDVGAVVILANARRLPI